MTAEVRDIRMATSTTSSSDLAMIEFQSQLPRYGGDPQSAVNPAEAWLEGQSSQIERLRLRATNAGREGAAVTVIRGEAGSGKLRVAQWVHRCSRRQGRPFMILDGSNPSTLSHLQGVVRGLTQNSESTPGTLAIRNFQDLPRDCIQTLLEILTVQGVELRCGLALLTTRDVGELRAISLQHAQLLGRVANAVIECPSLRERSGDITFLARRFVQESSRRYRKDVRGISPQAISRLESHNFPGNVRELQSMIEQAVLHSSGDWITAESFSGLGGNSVRQPVDQAEVVIRLPGSSLREIEVQALRLALKISGGRIVRASELLGITRHALRRKLEKFGLSNLRNHYEDNNVQKMNEDPTTPRAV